MDLEPCTQSLLEFGGILNEKVFWKEIFEDLTALNVVLYVNFFYIYYLIWNNYYLDCGTGS